MAAMSSERKERLAKKSKGGTTSTRKHRFESFTQRISKLNIEPVRRVRRIDVDQDDVNTATSYLKIGLDRWKDLNLSENFTHFVHEAEPLCDSLPQILHYNNCIFDLLIGHIEKRDLQSLEPLLSLLGSFAHDLGIKFEKHFSRAVTLVTSLAINCTDVQAIEWSFTCLAWLFKYLSRLLVPDLTPLFQIMAPLLGREPQKAHNLRFAAEAMSFLVRKAALVYHKDSKPLTILIDWILTDLEILARHNEQTEDYQHGLMILLIDSIKGIDRRLHSCADSIYRCLIQRVLDKGSGQTILNGVTIGLIHFTDALNFQPILDIILQGIKNMHTVSNISAILVFDELLLVVATVRKGSRIQDWAPVLDALASVLDFRKKSAVENLPTVYKATAVILQSAPLEIVISRHRQVLDMVVDNCNAGNFLPFCNYFCDLGRECFRTLLLPYFSRFVLGSIAHIEYC